MTRALQILGGCLLTGLLLVLPPVASARAAESEIVLASTTSTEGSGLFALILPKFEARSGIRVRAVATGTGQALRMARRGDADVLLVHDADAWGYGRERAEELYPIVLESGQKALEELRSAGVRMEAEKREARPPGAELSGKTFVITGTTRRPGSGATP